MNTCNKGNDLIEYLSQALEMGKVLLMLCDTIYGLVSKAPDTYKTLEVIKGRPENKPFLQLFADIKQLKESPLELPSITLQKFWPGPLTCVLSVKTKTNHNNLVDGSQAVRIPQHQLLQTLCRVTRSPLYSSSANRSGQAVPKTQKALLQEFATEISAGLIIPYFTSEQASPTTKASTIVDARYQSPKILRQGDLFLNL